MDSLEANKIVGAVLGTVFVLFGGSLLADAIFHSEVPEKPGYAIVAAEAPAAGEAAGGAAAAAVPIATLLASASPEKGAVQFKKCQACHDGSDGGANKVGPHLYDVVNRPMASVADFAYSAGIKDFSKGSSVKWDFDHLNHFLAGPKAYVNGTAMGFAGLKNDQDRADLISYLRTLSHSPAPLPDAPAPGSAADAAPAPAAPAEQQAAAAPAAPAPAAAAPAAAPAAPAAAAPAAAPAPAPAAATPVQTASAGDTKAGAAVFRKCQACHAVGEGAANKVGPELNGIDGEKIAEVTGYTFSAALTTFAGSNPVWTDELLGKWLTDPKALVPGTKMAFPGLKKPEEIANVIAYLKSFDETGKPKGN